MILFIKIIQKCDYGESIEYKDSIYKMDLKSKGLGQNTECDYNHLMYLM